MVHKTLNIKLINITCFILENQWNLVATVALTLFQREVLMEVIDALIKSILWNILTLFNYLDIMSLDYFSSLRI